MPKTIGVICTERSILESINGALVRGPVREVYQKGISFSVPMNGVVLSRSPNGLVPAASHCATLCALFQFDLVIHFGTAGAVGNKLPIGTLVRVSKAVQWDQVCSAIGFNPGEMPRGEVGTAIPIDGASLCSPDIPAGVILSGSQFVKFDDQPPLLSRMVAAHDGNNVLVDMEASAVDYVFQVNGIDCFQFRVVMNNASYVPSDYNSSLRIAGGTCAKELLTIIDKLVG